MRTKRLFVCIELPDSITEFLAHLDPNLRGVRWLTPEQMHLTLSFLGSVSSDAEEKLRENLSTIRVTSFFLSVGGVGTFPAKGRPKIIWTGVGSGHPHLFQLYKRVQEAVLAAGIEPDLRPWHPHITLARCNESIDAAAVRQFVKTHADVEVGLIRVTSFALYSSELTPAGSVYTRELEVAL